MRDSPRLDPSRPAERLAGDIQRRVVEPWQVKLAQVIEAQAKALDSRQQTIARARHLGRILGTPERDIERWVYALEQGTATDINLQLGSFGSPVHAEIKVENYRQRTTFEITRDKWDFQKLFVVPAGIAVGAALLLLFFFHPPETAKAAAKELAAEPQAV